MEFFLVHDVGSSNGPVSQLTFSRDMAGPLFCSFHTEAVSGSSSHSSPRLQNAEFLD